MNTENSFSNINSGYNTVFRPGRLSIGLVAPLESYANSAVPHMKGHLQRAQLADSLGFAALWLRDVPFNVPSFGDAGQLFDPFVYLGALAMQTERIALGVSSIVLPLRHPAHVAKAAASADALSGGRLILGVASGDRPEEYPALNLNHAERSQRFRESFEYIRHMGEHNPQIDNHYGALSGHINMLPKPVGDKLPLMITGGSQQSPDWLARHGDGWMLYPRNTALQAKIIRQWREHTEAAGRTIQPVMQPLYVDLTEDSTVEPQPIHLGMRLGSDHLVNYLRSLEQIGVNHVALNLRFNQLGIEQTLERIAKTVLPEFPSQHSAN